MDPTTINDRSYYLPSSVSEIQELITIARQQKKQIRVCGSLHSVSAAIYPDQNTAGGDSINVILAKMKQVQIDTNKNIVTVDAGCHLGYDPFDIVASGPMDIIQYASTWENSLFKQLYDAHYAVPDMGGITHQTVGGFLSTGSSGGSTQYSFNESLLSITFVPADEDNPQPVTVSLNDENKDLFYALGVSMGLLGIIVSATFSLIPTFNIIGSETITSIADASVDITGTGVVGKMSMRDFLTQTEYARILWYPQPGVARSTVWQARRMQPGEPFHLKPYEELPKIAGSELPAELAADLVYSTIGRWPNWLGDIIGTNSVMYQKITDYINNNFYSSSSGLAIFPQILNLFVPLDSQDNGNFKSQQFQDYWYSSLPMDNNISDKLFPVEFTELWIPFDINDPTDSVNQVLRALNDLFNTMYANSSGPIPAGAFCTELYAAKKSAFWMSPAYNTDVFRVDVFWFGNNIGSPADEFYPLFWKALQPFKFRCHWGKYLPSPNSDQGANYLSEQFPKWKDFMELREKYDPLQIFLSDYWRQHLGIKQSIEQPASLQATI